MHHTCNCLKVCVEAKGVNLTRDDGDEYYRISQKLYDLARELCPQCRDAKPVLLEPWVLHIYHADGGDRVRMVNTSHVVVTEKQSSE